MEVWISCGVLKRLRVCRRLHEHYVLSLQTCGPRFVAVMVEYSKKKLEFKDHNDREVAGAQDEKVIEAFQKFDADGSGSISKDELAQERALTRW